MLIALFDHLIWADRHAKESIQQMPDTHPDANRARLLYAHLAASVHIWLARLEGRPPEHAVWPDLDLARASALATESATRLSQIAAAADEAALSREVVYRNSAGNEFRNSVADILAHVALHGSYHRGQLAMLVRQSGAQPVNTDYITFRRGAAAQQRT